MTDKNTKAQGGRTQAGQTQTETPREMSPETPRDNAGLQYRYGSIGIEAVAAACRYSNPGKKSAEPATRIDQRFEQAG
jgi:hypothetical protein